MLLKSIELFGFKSFADRSKIELRDGISALIGPNGCGKSNIVDAVKWVLGEQATKSMRAVKMEDVIFNGTEGRKPLNVAEVSIVLSDSEGVLPIDLPEISIKRRLFRSGESEYFINKTPVKLKELRELFFDTGIGKTAYSIMEQGRIDQILSNKPEDRRYLFEEAAGITKYKVKGAEAEKKLKKTEDNMRQVESILNEVKRSYESLKKQAEKTKTYRILHEQIFEFERDMQLLKLRDLLENRDNTEEKVKEKTEQRDTLKLEIAEINNSLENSLDLVNSMETKLIDNQKKLYGIDVRKGGNENQLFILNERKNELKQQVISNKTKENTINEKLLSLKKQISGKKGSLKTFSLKIEEIEKNIEEFNLNIGNSGQRISNNEKGIIKIKKEIIEYEKTRDNLQKELDSITDDIVAELDIKLKETGYSYYERKKVEESINNTLESLSIMTDGKINILEDAAMIGQVTKENTKEIIQSGIAALTECLSGLSDVKTLFKDYKNTIPAFIDDFLAPEGIITKKRRIDTRIEEIKGFLIKCREELSSLNEENESLRIKIDEYRRTLGNLRVHRAEIQTQITGIEETIVFLEEEVRARDVLLSENRKEIEYCEEKIKDIDIQFKTINTQNKEFEDQEKLIKKELVKLKNEIQKKNKDFSVKEKKLKESAKNLEKMQLNMEKLQIDFSVIKTDIRNLYENFRDHYSRDLSEYESGMYEIYKSIKEIRTVLLNMKEKEKNLGQVNLMAVEEFSEIKERYDFLNNQLGDLKNAKEDLKNVTKQIKIESTERFIETYDKIKKNFHIVFRRLFGGGRTELKLIDPDNILTSGIEIYAQPTGKKLENITLLSGGEKSLTAVALLFAAFMVKPSPFCILDEIDAALDEENVNRFVNLLVDFGAKSQFVVITHNKRTITGSKTLIGVTMEESGVSKIVSVSLEQEDKLEV